MATIIVEDGSIVAGANSYASESDLQNYADDRGITISGDQSELLIKSMDWIETQNFKGQRYTKEQPLEWPREGVYIDGFQVDNNEIPEDLKIAEMALALEIDQGNDPMAATDRATKKEKVDVIEVEYMDGTRDTPYLNSVNRYLNKLVINGSGGGLGIVRTVRA